jgi:hypothetical protein
VFTLNQQVKPDFACTDAGAVSGCTGAPLVGGFLDTSTVGPHTFTVTATDLAGNTSTRTVTYFVRFAFNGFNPPVDNPPTVNVAKAGSTIPLKWSLQNAAGQFISDLNTVTSVSWQVAACENGPSDAIEETVTPGLVPLTYDAVGNQFIYAWKTDKTWAGKCVEVFVAFSDDTMKTAEFKFK